MSSYDKFSEWKGKTSKTGNRNRSTRKHVTFKANDKKTKNHKMKTTKDNKIIFNVK